MSEVMNQMHTEYLIDLVIQDRHAEAARLDQLREARAGNAGSAPGVLGKVFSLFHFNRPQATRVRTMPSTAIPSKQALPC